MIKISKTINDAPNDLLEKGKIATEELCKLYNEGEREFKNINSKIYGLAKPKLKELQFDKCCFCESKISHNSHGDVEHFRPKGGWVQENENQNKPGYYWLAYNWENLLLSCQICNQSFKGNLFPLKDNSKRAKSHNDDISKEEPIFINPFLENPEEFIEFVYDIPKAKNGNDRGIKTIEKLGLDREQLNERRRELLNEINLILDIANKVPETNEDLVKSAKLYLLNKTKNNSEYSLMAKCYLKNKL
ncbi:MAG: hypothetical protein KA275_04805 [Chitinophagaceae bacterium]|nr:hypothetical protein [Chitinophagaceae bacterium]